MSPAARAKLAQAKARLDTLDWYPRPVRIRRVRLISAPWLFRLPWFRRFDGYATWGLVLVRMPVHEAGDDLVTHELCHVWQMQHHPIAMPLSYLYRGYANNPYEAQARLAAETTTRFGLCDSCRHQRLVRSGRGSVFTMCLLSKTDARFPKYPRVPVLDCDGHDPRS